MRQWLMWAVVAAVAVAGLGGVEVWPLTAWRLFTYRRAPVVRRFEARAVAADGSEAPIPFGRLPHGFSGSGPLLERMAHQPAGEREPVCQAWAAASGSVTGTPVAAVRVYQVEDDLRTASSRATLAWTCARGAR